MSLKIAIFSIGLVGLAPDLVGNSSRHLGEVLLIFSKKFNLDVGLTSNFIISIRLEVN